MQASGEEEAAAAAVDLGAAALSGSRRSSGAAAALLAASAAADAAGGASGSVHGVGRPSLQRRSLLAASPPVHPSLPVAPMLVRQICSGPIDISSLGSGTTPEFGCRLRSLSCDTTVFPRSSIATSPPVHPVNSLPAGRSSVAGLQLSATTAAVTAAALSQLPQAPIAARPKHGRTGATTDTDVNAATAAGTAAVTNAHAWHRSLVEACRQSDHPELCSVAQQLEAEIYTECALPRAAFAVLLIFHAYAVSILKCCKFCGCIKTEA